MNQFNYIFLIASRNINTFLIITVLLLLSIVITLGFRMTRSKDSSHNYNLIDSAIISHVIELLSDTKDVNSTINKILGLLGTFYDLNYIGIVTVDPDTNNGNISHEWHCDTSIEWNCNIVFTQQELDDIRIYNRKNNGYCVTNNIDEAIHLSEPLRALAVRYQVKGLLECSMTEKTFYNSNIFFSFTNENRSWTQQEVDTLLLVTKILRTYLINHSSKLPSHQHHRLDPLTQCNNQASFYEEALNQVRANPTTQYIMFSSDINRFKLFNEKYGYDEGDRILIEFAKALQSITNEDETCGHFGTDKFVGLFNYENPKQFLSKIKSLNNAMNSITPPDSDHPYQISIIIGLSIMDKSFMISKNLDQANMARQSITNRHKSRYAFFNDIMKMKLMTQHDIESHMELALKQSDFKVYYQPKFSLTTNEPVGAEALVRWYQKENRIIYPNDFIPIFEENEFIIKLDYYVFEEVCKHIRKLLDLGIEPYPVSVNFSRLHLNNKDIIDKLEELIKKYDISASYLEIELTESALQYNNNYMFMILLKLHKMGFKISMDDFGSGLSSLNLLRTLPCDTLKLDKDFFQQGASTERERIVIATIVKMAKDLHMTIVSEGVENTEQAEFLRSIDCDLAQGYLFSKPLSQQDYEKTYYNLD